jgi:hypothetical protein
VVRHACEVVGAGQLAQRLDVSRAVVEGWLAGKGMPPPRAFLKILSLLRAADPTYHPLADRLPKA